MKPRFWHVLNLKGLGANPFKSEEVFNALESPYFFKVGGRLRWSGEGIFCTELAMISTLTWGDCWGGGKIVRGISFPAKCVLVGCLMNKSRGYHAVCTLVPLEVPSCFSLTSR